MSRYFNYTAWAIALSLLFIGSSCRSTKDFQSAVDLSPPIISYLKSEPRYDEDFLSAGLQADETAYCPVIGEPQWVVPSENILQNIEIGRSNNNVSLAAFGDRLYMTFRTGPTHFASEETRVYVLSSPNGKEWTEELNLHFERDIREPYLIEIEGKLHFYFFTAGTSFSSFAPEQVYHYEKALGGTWSEKDRVLLKGEVHWSMKKRGGKLYLVSYHGSHYELRGESKVSLFLRETQDGSHFYPADDSARVYLGGVSECGFEFDYEGNLWAVTRLEDGDATGFGSHVAFADKDNIRDWEFPKQASKRSYMSPKLFNHNNEIYLVARKQRGKKPFGKTSETKSMRKQRLRNWVGYSLTPKTTALFKINKANRSVEWLADLPGNGDTAFPSILRLSNHQFLIANYSSPLNRRKNRSWLSGQLGKTGIYFLMVDFVPCGKK